jgi:glutamyl-tRNA(Gln) amidotransferase subunit E
MTQRFNPLSNYNKTKEDVGYVLRTNAQQADYDRVGFKAGLEIHQQLKTKKKLFCNCPAGIYHDNDDINAEIIRHMRPTLSELGEYDGTALMEFKTRKTIVYKIKNRTTCTYDIDDTPPFPINREALDIALEIALLCKLNIVGEVHITRKQYLDGSIPTGFQRTAILGIEGQIQLKNKKVRLIQLSLEEDSCREISDIAHVRTYKTDRLGIPLIETVTYPDFSNPDEVREGAEYIRFLNRSTGKVRIGIGTGREDVNVSCRGGTRVEIKGVSHNRSIPELTHNEVFRQWALLKIREKLQTRFPKPESGRQWTMSYKKIKEEEIQFDHSLLQSVFMNNLSVIAVNLPGFKGILSHFTQPGKIFADELSDRLKVIACLEKPNMVHSEQIKNNLPETDLQTLQSLLDAGEDDAQILLWGPDEDIPTALETVEERCRMAFDRVPNESRKSMEDGTTIFERVLPGADRMYPDTDSPPIPIDDERIEEKKKGLPVDIHIRYGQLKKWEIPEDTYTYILRNNLSPLLEKILSRLDVNPKWAGTFFGHTVKHIEGQRETSPDFQYERIFDFFCFLEDEGIEFELAKKAVPLLISQPKKDFKSVLQAIHYKKSTRQTLLSKIPELKNKFQVFNSSNSTHAEMDWMMGKLRDLALGNMPLTELSRAIEGEKFETGIGGQS